MLTVIDSCLVFYSVFWAYWQTWPKLDMRKDVSFRYFNAPCVIRQLCHVRCIINTRFIIEFHDHWSISQCWYIQMKISVLPKTCFQYNVVRFLSYVAQKFTTRAKRRLQRLPSPVYGHNFIRQSFLCDSQNRVRWFRWFDTDWAILIVLWITVPLDV